MGAWLKSELAPVVRELLGPRVVRNRGLFDPDAVASIVADHAASRTRTVPTRCCHYSIWRYGPASILMVATIDDVADELTSLAALEPARQ